MPSVALDEPSYSDDSHLRGLRLIWRGPCSMNTNWFLHQGLLRHGEAGYASQLAQRSQDLVERGGFNEFYDARPARPVGADGSDGRRWSPTWSRPERLESAAAPYSRSISRRRRLTRCSSAESGIGLSGVKRTVPFEMSNPASSSRTAATTAELKGNTLR